MQKRSDSIKIKTKCRLDFCDFIAQYRIMRYSICFQTYLDDTNRACYKGVTHKTAVVTSFVILLDKVHGVIKKRLNVSHSFN